MQASNFLRDRLTDPLCPGVALRPQLSTARDKLYTLLSNAVEKPGANSSYLLIGARGTGKTLVSHLDTRHSHRSAKSGPATRLYNQMIRQEACCSGLPSDELCIASRSEHFLAIQNSDSHAGFNLLNRGRLACNIMSTLAIPGAC